MNTRKTPISILQEMMQQRNLVPHYQLLSEHGCRTHNPTFMVRVYADGITGIGKGTSKKIAKQEAARNCLQRIGEGKIREFEESKQPKNVGSDIRVIPKVVYEEPETSATIVHNFENNTIAANIRKKAVAVLKYYTMQLNLPSPSYEEISASGPDHERVFTYKCSIGAYSQEAPGRTKIEARDKSALLMFEALKKLNFEIPKYEQSSPPRPQTAPIKTETCNDGDKKPTENISCISQTNNTTIASQSQSSPNSSMYHGPCKKRLDHFFIIKNYMFAKKITYEELWKNNVDNDYKTLENVLNTLGIDHNLTIMKQETTYIVYLFINIIPAFYLVEIGGSIGETVKSVAKNMLFVLRVVTK